MIDVGDLERTFAYIDAHQDEYFSQLGEFVHIGSTASCPEEREKARKFIEKRFREAAVDCKRVPIQNGNALLCGRKEGRSDRTVLLYNHYDVVEPGNPDKWESKDPYHMVEKNGYLYARGVSDDKGPLLSRIQAIEAILKVVGELPVGVRFLFEGDEESGSPSMMSFAKGHLDEFAKYVQSDVCFWENGRRQGDGGPWARYGVRGNCAFDLKVKTASNDVHGRMGAVIPSASWRLVWALSLLKGPDEKIRIPGFYDDIVAPTEEEMKVLDAFPYGEEAQKEKLELSHFVLDVTGLELKKRLYYEPTLSICGLEAGEMYKGPRGIVPHEASARISCYLVANQDPERIAANLKKYLADQGFSDVEVRYLDGTVPVKTPIQIPETPILEKAAQLVYGKPLIKEITQMGAGPAIALRWGKPGLKIIGIGPGNTNGNHHAPNENIRKEDYIKSMKMLVAFLYGYGEAE